MARKPSNFITVRDDTVITFGGRVMEHANYPPYLFAEWTADHVTFKREEDYDGKGKGIYKIGRGGGVKGGRGQARIAARALIESTGLQPGRYIPISVNEDSIVIATTPFQTPDQYERRTQSDSEDEDA